MGISIVVFFDAITCFVIYIVKILIQNNKHNLLKKKVSHYHKIENKSYFHIHFVNCSYK